MMYYKKMRVWWIPQVPMKAFHVYVDNVEEGCKVMEVLAEYDKFQLINNLKPDYCNAGGIQVFDPDDDYDSPNGSWVSWCDEETGEDDPFSYVADKLGVAD